MTEGSRVPCGSERADRRAGRRCRQGCVGGTRFPFAAALLEQLGEGLVVLNTPSGASSPV